MFALWLGAAHRPTRDLDLLGYGSEEIGQTVETFRAICRQMVEDDGLVFEEDTVTSVSIREGQAYDGTRVTLRASLGKAIIPLQIDIGFGDVVTPAAQEADMPTLLDTPKARLLVYPRETVIAKKCEALVDLGLANTRLKDFYDLWHLATHFDFEGMLLCEAIAATFQRRSRVISVFPTPALTAAFYENTSRQKQWASFWARGGLSQTDFLSLEQCVESLQVFLLPVLQAVQNHTDFHASWRYIPRAWQL